MPVINAFRIMKFVITALALLTASCSSQVSKLDLNLGIVRKAHD